ncbi:DUF5361 domain-containing protein [Bifidobacterium oedipodis]|uniref:Phage protein n=1 Tax=Bifidobacterium oedipodis TaxID=2675322 RepID=A0A7Y0END9_9BIFI|nr:phage protein [Bifidobacterium sp. DSM 109957]
MDREPKRLAAVLWLIDNHRDELEYELIKAGVRLRWLGRPLLSWHDIYLIAANCEPGTPLATALDRRMAWKPIDFWMRSIEYSLRWLVWAKTKDGQKGRGKPKPIQPPGISANDPNRRSVVRKGELAGMDKQSLRDYLNRPRTASGA